MFKHISFYSWFSFLPFMFLGLLTLIFYSSAIIPLYYLFFTVLGWILISGLGVAVGYHRIFSHNTHPKLPRWKENIILFLGTLSGQGSSIYWVAIHRGYHHRFSDKPGDLHSPKNGIYHSFFGWTTNTVFTKINLKYSLNLLRKRNHVWFHKHNMKILWLTPIIVSLIDWKLSLSLLCLPTCLALLQDNLVNVLGHIKAIIGYRNFKTDDCSHNNVFLGYLGWGQGWHNNHHHDPKSYDFGKGISGKWWEFDPCKIFLPLLK